VNVTTTVVAVSSTDGAKTLPVTPLLHAKRETSAVKVVAVASIDARSATSHTALSLDLGGFSPTAGAVGVDGVGSSTSSRPCCVPSEDDGGGVAPSVQAVNVRINSTDPTTCALAVTIVMGRSVTGNGSRH
jgi:hypothetical protein